MHGIFLLPANKFLKYLLFKSIVSLRRLDSEEGKKQSRGCSDEGTGEAMANFGVAKPGLIAC